MTNKDQINLNANNFFDKVSRISRVMESQPETKAMVINLGQVKDEQSQPKACLFHLWFLAFEFSETAIGIS